MAPEFSAPDRTATGPAPAHSAPAQRPVPVWQRYVAVGDSMTEGLWDHAPGAEEGPMVGWADRLAAAMAKRQIDDGARGLQYANLAIRGRLLGPIISEQLPRALQMGPDLISIVGGGNDLLRPGADPDQLAAQLESAVRQVRAQGVDVLIATGADTSFAPLLAAIRPKVGVLNAAIWSIARRTGAYVLDVWGMRALKDSRLWASDRIHLTADGHRRVANAALVGLGLGADDPDWARPLPRQGASTSDKLRSDGTWLKHDVIPWALRHARGHSSGDGRKEKRPELSPIEAVSAD